MARFPCAKFRASSALQAETHTRILPLPQDWHTRSNNHQIAQEYPSARRLPILIGFRDAEPYIPFGNFGNRIHNRLCHFNGGLELRFVLFCMPFWKSATLQLFFQARHICLLAFPFYPFAFAFRVYPFTFSFWTPYPTQAFAQRIICPSS